MTNLFHGARLKLERAKHHINDLKDRGERFARDNPHEITIKNDMETGDDFIYITPAQPLPTELLLILGDAIHNMRSALDHAWNATLFDREKFTRFPIRETEEALKNATNGAKQNAPKEVIDFIENTVQPYDGGKGDAIWQLDCLDVVDKHKLLIAHIEYRTVTGVKAIDEAGCNFEIPEWLLVHGHIARYRCIGHKNVQVTDNGNVTIRVVFGKGMPFESAFVIPLLRNLLLFVSGTLDALETVLLSGISPN